MKTESRRGKKKFRQPMAMMQRAVKGMKLPARDNRTIKIKYVKAVETRRKSSQKQTHVSNASAMRPNNRWTVSWNNLVLGLRLIPINHLLVLAPRRSSHAARQNCR